jgi:hypothetical protein
MISGTKITRKMKRMSIVSYSSAEAYLGSKEKRKLAHETYLVRVGNDLVIRYHDTNVVVYHADRSITLDSGGWRSPTTRRRFEEFGSVPIEQRDSSWFVRWWGREYIFDDGMRLRPDASVIYAKEPPDADDILKLSKRVNKYARDFAAAFIEGQVEAPSGGDCWHCLFEDESRRSWDEASNDKEHLHSHMEEPYYVPSLLVRAMEKYGAVNAERGAIWSYWDPERALELWEGLAKRTVYKYVRKYMRHQLELP